MIQIPPTPTPLPPGAPIVGIPVEYTIWGSTDAAIHYWNWLGVVGVFIQGFVLLVIVLIGIKILTSFIKEFTREDAEE